VSGGATRQPVPGLGATACRPVCVHAVLGILVVFRVLASATAAVAADEELAFRVRPYLQNPAADGMTVRWLSDSSEPGIVTCDDRTFTSAPRLCRELAYGATEPTGRQHPSPPFLHSLRISGLQPATSYPYTVTQDGTALRAVLTTSPRPGTVGRGGAVRLFFLADCRARRDPPADTAAWPPTTALPGGPRPRWVGDRYPVDRATGYRMNLALIADRAAESLRAGNPVLGCIAGDLVEHGGMQRDWDQFWLHNAGSLGTLASRVPLVVAFGDRDIFGGPRSGDPLRDLGGYTADAVLIAARRLLTYFEHPENGAGDERHEGRYHRIDFGPVTLLTLDTTNGGTDGGPDDTNHELDRRDAPGVPDYAEGSEQRAWLERELIDARRRGVVTFVMFHHAPFSSGPQGRPPGEAIGQDRHSGRPLRALAPLFAAHGVRAVFTGHEQAYEHSAADGVHYVAVGSAGGDLPGPQPGLVNERQIFSAQDRAPERWESDVLASGGRHYGHVEVDVTPRPGGGGFTVSITPVYVFPVLDPQVPGEVVTWQRRTYDDVRTFDVGPMTTLEPEEKP
jgi:hypothetical protein